MPNDGLWWHFFRRQSLVTAAKPDPTTAIFLAGGSNATFVIRERSDGWDTKEVLCSEAKAATSIDWIDHNVYMTGERGGVVRLWDVRNDGTSLRYKHPAAINHVKKLDEQRIAVAGLENKVNPPLPPPPPGKILLFFNS